MDLFGLVSFLIMGSATLCGLSLLLWLVIMERKADRCEGQQVAARSHGGQATLARPQQPPGRWPAGQHKAARRTVTPGSFQARARTRGSGRV
jgi:hypothetical protein